MITLMRLMNVVLTLTVLRQRNVRRNIHPPGELVFLLPEKLAPDSPVTVGVRADIDSFRAAKVVSDFFSRNGVSSIRIQGGPAPVGASNFQAAIIEAIEQQRHLPEVALDQERGMRADPSSSLA